MPDIASPQLYLADELSLAALSRLFRKHRALIVACAVVLAITAFAFAIARPAMYRSDTAFAPRTGKASSSSVSGLAAQFGIAVPGADPADSPQFYADLVMRRAIIDTVLLQPYALPSSGGQNRRTLAEVLAPKAGERNRMVDARRALRKRIATDVDTKTNVVTVAVSTSDPALSQAVATQVLRALNGFTLSGRQSRAHQERLFVEARANDARQSLVSAESALEGFLEDNRSAAAPRLEFAQDRLRREVNSRQQLYTSLAEAADQARIEELRDTPSLTVVEEPELPVTPESRGLLTLPPLGFVFGGLLGFFLAFAIEMLFADRPAEMAAIEPRSMVAVK